ncbi:protein phosphatase 1 regulatory subunit 35 [Scyliorhinus canicula]|uniref:protein phosphatase 1 regulatory subunit 35 n=1 Tax=Scyliorhinus canicula TaxID=7830 RepID=UPI0018F3B579|nr:protein phosphatase 1 regulatory subunit 35 [Scyliorhinus canicula]
MKTDTLGFPAKMYTPQNYTDEDSLPIRAVPAPLLVGPDRMDTLSELDVSLTPDKIGKSVGILKRREGLDGDVVRGKVSRRQVRFDTGSESKGGDNEELTPGDLDGGEEEWGTIPVNPTPESAPEGDERNVQTPTDPSSVFSADRKDGGPAHRDPWKAKAARPARLNKQPRQRALLGGAGDRPLATPEYNTTLALGQELQQLREGGFNARRAAAERLKRSSVTRQSVEGKVAEGLNVPKDLQRYKGLVSLEVPVDEVLSVAVQEKMLLVRPKAANKKQSDGMDAPDLMIFYDPLELLTETPYLSVDGLPPLKVQAQPKPATSPFDLYRKLKQWEA